jgi:hypothetical protein
MRAVLSSIVLAALLAGCGRGHSRDEPAVASAPRVPAPGEPAPASRTPAPVADPPRDPACDVAALPLRLPAPPRLVAIGDLHGDLGGARAALRTAGAIDDRDRWIGGGLVVVQTGDVLDRGDDEQALLDLLARLEVEAHAAGGAVIQLLGNHELMNAAGDFRYVTPGGLHDFDDAPLPRFTPPANVPDAMRGRLGALGPGGSYARRLAQHAVVAIVGDTIFSHAGVLGPWVTRIDDVNHHARCWLDGQDREPPSALTFDDSPVWTRAAGMPTVDCAALSASLTALLVERMVVGHTVQEHGITSACNATLWRIDVGLAKHYGGPIEVLELVPGAAPKVLHGTR